MFQLCQQLLIRMASATLQMPLGRHTEPNLKPLMPKLDLMQGAAQDYTHLNEQIDQSPTCAAAGGARRPVLCSAAST